LNNLKVKQQILTEYMELIWLL